MKSKTIASLVLSLFLAVPMFGQNLSVNYKERTIDKVLSDLESKTNYSFVYQKQELSGVPAITLELQNAPFLDILNSVCAEAGLSYEIVKQSIVLKKGQSKQVAKAATVNGVVTDQNGEPVIGASVFEKGTNNGVSTDAKGRYSIVTKPGATLVFSCIGYAEANRFAAPGTINVALADDTNLLEETVVIGYGVQKKSDLTGSISSVKSDALQNRSVNDVTAALAGKVSGVQILSGSAMPGEIGTIRIRGLSSNDAGAAAPLYVVDGVQVTNLSFIDPQDIESIEVLKDGASAAIYGAQAGNGIVLVTTKKGAKGKGFVTYDGSYTFENVGFSPRMMNAREYIDEMILAGEKTQATIDALYDGHTDTDWIKETFTGGYAQRHKVGVQGGNDKGNLYSSISYLKNDGMLKTDKDEYTRLNFQLNAEYKIKDWLTVGTNNTFSITHAGNLQNTHGADESLFSMTSGLDPLTPFVYSSPSEMPEDIYKQYEEGKLLKFDNGEYPALTKFLNWGFHPFRDILQYKKKFLDTNMLSGNLYATITPIKDIVFMSKLGYTATSSENMSFQIPYSMGSASKANPSLSDSITKGLNYQWDNYVNYSKSIAFKHNLNVMAGMSCIKKNSTYITGVTDQLKNYADNFLYLSYSADGAGDSLKGNPSYSSSISYFGRLGYNYDNKYYIQGTFRADAFDASYLSEDSRWGFFPSISIGWNILNEPFMSGINKDRVSYLKLRGSWGTNGNISVLAGKWAYTADVVSKSYNAMFTNTPALTPGMAPSVLANPGLKWETSKQIDFGVDARFFSDRLSASLDLYHKTTDGLLVDVTVPKSSGFSSMKANAGTVVNKGIELELCWKDKIGDFHYNISGNIAHNSNCLTDIDPSIPYINGAGIHYGDFYVTRMEKGFPLWYFHGYNFKGVDPQTGKGIYEDKDGNGYSIDDKEMIGSPFPDFTYGLTINAEYKGFDLTIYGTGSYGNDIYFAGVSRAFSSRNLPIKFVDKTWHSSGDNSCFPSLGEILRGSTDKFIESSGCVMDGSYFRVNQLQLGYTLPSGLLNKIKLSSLRVYVSLDDYFTFTKYIGFDPATAADDAGSGLGLDRGTYPTPKKAMFGVNLMF